MSDSQNSKRPRLAPIWISKNDSIPQTIPYDDVDTISDLLKKLLSLNMLAYSDAENLVVLKDGSPLIPQTLIPSTSVDSPLQFLTRIVVQVIYNGGKVIMKMSPRCNVFDLVNKFTKKDFFMAEECLLWFEGQEYTDYMRPLHEIATSKSNPLYIFTQFDVTYVIKYSEVSEFQDKHEKKELALKKIDVKLNDLVVEALKKEQIEHTTNVVVVHQDAKQNLGCHMKEFLFSLDEPFIISKDELSVKDNLLLLKKEVTPVSTFASFTKPNGIGSFRKNKTIQFIGGILWHRDNLNGNHVTLYYPGFANFSHDCDTISVDKEDCTVSLQICQEMCKFYACEDQECNREKNFKRILEPYLGHSFSVEHQGIDMCVLPGPCLIIETKREIGATDCETLTQAVGYYVLQLDENKCTSPRPCFIIELVGPHLIISGVVIGKNVTIDRLTRPIWLVVQPTNILEMINIARVLKSLRKAIHELVLYYNNLSSDKYDGYPVFKTFQKDEKQHKIQYIEEIKPHVFRGKIDENRIIIKFTERYGEDVHLELSQHGYAPKLLYFQRFEQTHLFVVVMEEVIGSQHIGDYLKKCSPGEREQIISKCEEALKIMSAQNYCHGDFRSSNILVDNNADIKVIDFDWAGVEGQTKYPYFMNHVNIEWPVSATDGAAIKMTHDQYWLNNLTKS